jgi:DNA-binding NarL/FixJ family response regulator
MFEQQYRVRIVIADDDAGVRRDLRDLLELTGAVHVVGDAADGLTAVETCRALQPDVVVLDLELPVLDPELPVLDGFATATRIKDQAPTCRVVALTVHGDEATRRRAVVAGFDAFVVKGAPLSELLGAIDPLTPRKPALQGGQS